MLTHRNLPLIFLVFVASAASAGIDQICTDRPSKSSDACTVPAGKWQIETGVIDWSKSSDQGQQSYSTALGQTVIKYGLTEQMDVELEVTPIELLRSRTGARSVSASSFGDTLALAKYRLTSEDSALEVALYPFVKLPTSNRRLGNGRVEGGIIVPINYAIGKSPLSVNTSPEFDWLANDNGGHHAAMVQVLNLAWQMTPRLNASGEIWGRWDWDPAGTTKQDSADLAFAYLAQSNVQLDWEADFGLNKETPDIELATGVSLRF